MPRSLSCIPSVKLSGGMSAARLMPGFSSAETPCIGSRTAAWPSRVTVCADDSHPIPGCQALGNPETNLEFPSCQSQQSNPSFISRSRASGGC